MAVFFIITNANIPFPLTLRKPEIQTLDGVGNLKFFCMMHIYEMAAISHFFHNGWHWYSISQAQIFHWFSFPITTPLSPSVSTFKCDDVSTLKTFIMTFLHLTVHDCWVKLSIGSIFPMTMPLYPMFMPGHSSMMTFLHSQKVPRKIYQNRLTHLCITVVNPLGNSSSHQQNRAWVQFTRRWPILWIMVRVLKP